MQLKGRLLSISQMVPSCKKVCDIGTDHAYVPIYLIKNNICNTAVATDIKKGPLERAKKNIDLYGLSLEIELRQGYGIEPVKLNECEVVIIAGMGGVLMTEILKESLEVVKNAKSLILQPMYVKEAVREFLLINGFNIDDESLSSEGDKIYVVIKAHYDGIKREHDTIYYHVGKRLFDKNDPLLPRYLEKKIKSQQKIVTGLKKSNNSNKALIEKETSLLNEFIKALENIKGE